jgi:hypothetical protein
MPYEWHWLVLHIFELRLHEFKRRCLRTPFCTFSFVFRLAARLASNGHANTVRNCRNTNHSLWARRIGCPQKSSSRGCLPASSHSPRRSILSRLVAGLMVRVLSARLAPLCSRLAKSDSLRTSGLAVQSQTLVCPLSKSVSQMQIKQLYPSWMQELLSTSSALVRTSLWST